MANALAQEDIRILEKTTRIRETMIDSMDHKRATQDPKELSAMVSLLDSLDRTILSKAKIKIEEDNNKTNTDIQATMASVLLGIHEKVNKQTRSNQSDITLPMDLTVEPVNGETFVGVDEINIAEFRNNS